MGVAKYWLLGLFAVTAAFGKVDVRVGLDVGKSEISTVHLFHTGHLFVGQGRETNDSPHYLNVFSPDLKTKVASLPLIHMVDSIQPFSPNQVLVVGKHFGSEWRGYYSIVTNQNGKFTTKTSVFAREYMPEFFAGDANNMFFNEVDIRGVFRYSPNGVAKAMPVTIGGAGAMAYLGNYLYVIQRANLFVWGDENLVRIDLKTQKGERVFSDTRGDLTAMQWLPGAKLLAVSERLGNSVHLVEPVSNKVASKLDVPSPRGLASFGNCLAVVSEELKQVQFFKVDAMSQTLVAKWDLGELASAIPSVRFISTDAANGRVYVRSLDSCPSCASSRNLVFVMEDRSKETVKACFE